MERIAIGHMCRRLISTLMSVRSRIWGVGVPEAVVTTIVERMVATHVALLRCGVEIPVMLVVIATVAAVQRHIVEL